ncbi:MAG: cupin domain-containing protein [Anaerolineaceae bacterium]|nr:cupin domain-containing protein [Anaerolineaceae bacterium]
MSDKVIPNVQNYSRMLQIQEGAVVSKTIINQKTGTITLFAFDKGEGLSEHAAPYDAFVEVIEGNLAIIISGNPYSLEKGDTIIMPANEPHALKATTPVKMLLVMIKS